jgi:hypothetical protein
MRKFAVVLGTTAALAGAVAAPAAAQTITPSSYDWGQVDPARAHTEPLAQFQLTAGGTALNGEPTVISGDDSQFRVLAGFCDGSLSANQSCIFRVGIRYVRIGATSAVVGVPGGPTATVKATFTGSSGKGGTGSKKKGCKRKGKKSASASGKKKCKKKGKK